MLVSVNDKMCAVKPGGRTQKSMMDFMSLVTKQTPVDVVRHKVS